MKVHIYEIGTGYQSNKFTATTKALTSYSGRRCINPQDVRISIERQKGVIILIPSTRTVIDKDVANIMIGKEIDAHSKRYQQYLQNKAKIYTMDLGQCTKSMENLLEGEEICENIDEESDVIHLLLIINRIPNSYESKSYPVLEIHMALRKFYSTYQSKSSSCDKYFKTMTNLK